MLSLLCVTKGADRALPFLRSMAELATELRAELVIAVDGEVDKTAVRRALEIVLPILIVPVRSKGYLESVLNEAIDATSGDWVLRLDDDERASPAMADWLRLQRYEQPHRDHWSFPRIHLWPDEQHILMNPPWFPDYQSRLTVRAKAHRPAVVHACSPFPSFRAPVAIEHHELLVKSWEERALLHQGYERVRGRELSIEDARASQPEAWPYEVQVIPYGEEQL